MLLGLLRAEDGDFAGDGVDLDCGEVGGGYAAVGLGVVFVVDGKEAVGVGEGICVCDAQGGVGADGEGFVRASAKAGKAICSAVHGPNHGRGRCIGGNDDTLRKQERARDGRAIREVKLDAAHEVAGAEIVVGEVVDADFHGEVAGDGGLAGQGELIAEALGGAGEVGGAGHIAEAADGCSRQDADDGYDDQQLDEGKCGGFFQEDTKAVGPFASEAVRPRFAEPRAEVMD